MTDAANEIKTILEAGTWSNYTSGPPIIIVENQDKMIAPANTQIKISSAKRGPVHAFNGSRIFSKDRCMLEITAENTTQRDNIYLDIEAILKANFSFRITGVSDDTPFENLIQQQIDIQILN